MAEDFTPRLPYGLSDLPAPPPDDFNPLYPPNDLASMGMQRAGEAQLVPAGFRLPLRRMSPPYPTQGGLAPGGGQLPEIPVPDWWKTWGPALGTGLQILPSIAAGRARRRGGGATRSRSQARDGDGDWCYQRYLQETKECDDNKDDYAHPDFLSACKRRATERWDHCNRNGGRPSPDEQFKWGKEDEDIYFETGR